MENKETNDRNVPNENMAIKGKLNDARKEGQTKGALKTAIVGFILLVALGVLAYSIYKRDHNTQLALIEEQKNSFTEQLTARDSMINEWLIAFDQIEKDLLLIKEKENLITMNSADSEFTKDRKDQILEDINSINTLLEANKERIASLSSQLKNSGATIKGLQARVETLEASVKQYETEIADLKTVLVGKDIEIGDLNTRVLALEDTVSKQFDRINSQIGELNKGFLASGTFKDLRDKGLVSKEGGFLGLGRQESLIEDFTDDSLFEIVDVTKTRTIPVNSRKAKLITEHPTGSYALIPEGENRIAYIEIKDPDQFWKISKYAVVELIK